jgi:type I restriction enzyme, S subunit
LGTFHIGPPFPAYIQREKADTLQIEAETALTGALGLQDWKPPEPLTYVRRASEVFAAHRLDAQYFAPRVAELIDRLGTRGTLREVATPRTERFVPANKGTFRYIEISDVNTDGTVGTTALPMSEAPSRATWYVREGDIVTSTVRPLRRLSAIITSEQEGSVASSGFLVLEPKDVPAEVLLTYLRLPNVCELMDLHTSASMYPAISDRDLLSMPFPHIPSAVAEAIVVAVRASQAARRKAHSLLEKAKNGVEIAIANSDSAAIEFLSKG